MFRSRFLRSIVLAIILIGLIGCSADKEASVSEDQMSVTGGELNVAYSAQPAVLDPVVNQVIATADIMRQVYEGLVTFDADYNVQPMLAESYEQSEDGKEITFHLREGVLFHNGEEMIAEDVVASMERWTEGAGSRGQFPDAIFEEIDTYTVLLTLPEPLSTVMTAIAISGAGFPAIMPKEINDNAGPEGVKEYIGTGPFKFVEWKQDQYVHLQKYEDYNSRSEAADGLSGMKEALVDDLKFIFVTEASTRDAGLRTGEYDVAHSMPLETVEELAEDENIINHTYPGGYMGLFFNKKAGLFTDVKARKALAIGLDMEDILMGSYSDEKYYDLSHNMMGTHQSKQWHSDIGEDIYNLKDTEQAKELLAEAGYDGEELTIITTRDYEDQYNTGVVVQEQMKSLGMDVKLEVFDWATLLDRIFDENIYDIFIMGNVAVPDPTISSYLLAASPGWTVSSELDAIIEEFRSKETMEEAKPLYDDLQAWFWDYIPMIKIGDLSTVSSTRSTVDNFRYQDGMVFWNVTNDK